jgi:predicted transcriptional regulator
MTTTDRRRTVERGGAMLTPRQAELFDLIDRHPGASQREIAALMGGISTNALNQKLRTLRRLGLVWGGEVDRPRTLQVRT